MANLLYRVSTGPATPSSTTAKGTPLTNLEVDGNFKSLNDSLILKAPVDSPAFTGSFTASTDLLNIGSGQIYKNVLGNVGIGTISPTCKLHVYTADAADSTLVVANAIGTLRITMKASGSGQIFHEQSQPIIFGTNNNERVRIDSVGNVGIGTIAPSTKLDVAGGIRGTSVNGITALSSTLPAVGGIAAIGVGTTVARADHAHQSEFSSGTKMVFYQAAAPVGWTVATADNDANLRVVSSGGGTSGGTDSPIIMNKVITHTHTFAGAALPAHVHPDPGHSHRGMSGQGTWYPLGGVVYVGAGFGSGTNLSGGAPGLYDWWVTYDTSASGTGLYSVSAGTPSGTNAAPAGAVSSWAPKYINVIICTRD